MERDFIGFSLRKSRCKISDCGKILSSKYNLNRHIETFHNGIRPYECEICYRRFSTKYSKREHVRLEHSYSITLSMPSNQHESHSTNLIQIPSLSSMLMASLDPDLRPLAKVNRIFISSDCEERKELPMISVTRQLQCTLPLI